MNDSKICYRERVREYGQRSSDSDSKYLKRQEADVKDESLNDNGTEAMTKEVYI